MFTTATPVWTLTSSSNAKGAAHRTGLREYDTTSSGRCPVMWLVLAHALLCSFSAGIEFPFAAKTSIERDKGVQESPLTHPLNEVIEMHHGTGQNGPAECVYSLLVRPAGPASHAVIVISVISMVVGPGERWLSWLLRL
ncbi:hypothetical protein PG984_000023 [Apiospora sp. TS-2023a]